MNNNNTFNFKAKEAIYQVILPLNLAMNIPADDSVRLLSKVMEEVNLGVLLNKNLRKSKIPEIVMLKVIIYGYMNGLYSSRKIETACKRDINFMWLLQGYPAPDHNTISRFRNILDSHEVFSRIVKFLNSAGEIKFDNLFIDGTKLEANANRYSFVWKASIEKHFPRLLEKKKVLLSEINSRHSINFCNLEGFLNYVDIGQFVSGKGKRKSQQQRDYEMAIELLDREKKYENYLKKLENRNSLSKTDNDATFMRLKEDHMKNGQLKPAYNIQIAVENEYIAETYISCDRDDVNTLKPMINKLSENYDIKDSNIVADAGYESEENYAYLDSCGYTSYIKPQNYEISKSSKFKNQIGKKENMLYDKKSDTFTCASGQTLKYAYSKISKTTTGYERNIKVYECDNCTECQKRNLCTKAKGNKKLQYSPTFERLREQSLRNISSEFGNILRLNRSIQVEGVFGVLKENYGFRRFLTRGNGKISTEFYLLCIAYNMKKLHNNILNDKLGCNLHKIKKE